MSEMKHVVKAVAVGIADIIGQRIAYEYAVHRR